MELHEHDCCDMQRVYKGAWTPEEDAILTAYMEAYGNSCRPWKYIATDAGLRRCGKSCRFRWLHYLHPSIDRRSFSVQEVKLICNLHRIIGNKWAEIAKFLPGRSDNSIKNFWNAYCKEPYLSIQHQQQLNDITTISSNNHQILQEDHNLSTNYDFTLFQPDQFFTYSVLNTTSTSNNHQSNLQDFNLPSINHDLPPLPESFSYPTVNMASTPMPEIGFNPTYDYSLFNDGNSLGWIDPSYSHNQVLEQPQYRNYVTGNMSFDHISSDLNNHDLVELGTNNVFTSYNNPSEGYSGTDMASQATNWDVYNSHDFIINTYWENNHYSLDPSVNSNLHHGVKF